MYSASEMLLAVAVAIFFGLVIGGGLMAWFFSRPAGPQLHFELYVTRDGHRWRLKSGDNELVLADGGEAYRRRVDAHEAIDAIKRGARDAAVHYL